MVYAILPIKNYRSMGLPLWINR